MASSMTGYGRAQETLNGRLITIELRSVNHRFFDCNVRAGRSYGYLEEALKTYLQKEISRGKVDAFITIDLSGADNVALNFNRPLFEGYLAIFKEVEKDYGLRDDISVSHVLRCPDVLNARRKEDDEDELRKDMLFVAEKALSGLKSMRETEGQRLLSDILERMDAVEALLLKIEERAPQTAQEYRERLEARIRELLENAKVDEQRLLTETAIFADRTAIAEETVRLKSHISQLRSMLREKNPVGRKLDFLVQEFNREANTIGSKASDIEISHMVVDLKSEIEKIREQVQNIE